MKMQAIPNDGLRVTARADMRADTRQQTGPAIPWLPFVQSLLAVLTVAVIAISVAPHALRLTGRQLVVLSGSSMGEAIPNGSGMIALPKAAESLRPGDVILFSAPWALTNGKPTNVAHRLQVVAPSPRGLLGYTAGDANVLADPEPVLLGQEQPVVAAVIPYLGFVYSSARSVARGLALASLALAALGILLRTRTPSPFGGDGEPFAPTTS